MLPVPRPGAPKAPCETKGILNVGASSIRIHSTGSPLEAGVAVAGMLFYDRKAREEERHLGERYPEYGPYRRRTHRFIPGIY